MIKFTWEALERLTLNQRDAILGLAQNSIGKAMAVNVFVNFDLPDDYVGFVRDLGAAGEITGGIDSQGNVST